MVNTKQKGNRVQRKGMEYLTACGWVVSKAEQGGKFNTEKDLFGLFDAVGVKPSQVLFVQFTTNRPHTHKKYKDFAGWVAYSNIYILQMVWYDRKGWKMFWYERGGTVKIEDMTK